jgi:ABC-type molybdenum transport system ATPase subunit/photorepair protein PhrA
MDARGGGMAAVTGFMIRLVVLLLTPRARRILFLDETFRFVSSEYEGRLAEFLAEVAERAGVQLVLVTHSDAFNDAADAHYHIELGSDGMAVARSVR